MFTTPEHAQKLLSANERIVRLTLADSQRTFLYVHPAFLKACSSVLCDMLDAVDSQLCSADPYYSIPLGDTDATQWTAVLSMIHPSAEPFKITCGNVMDLLLLAHKYDMPCVTGQVVAFLDTEEPATVDSSSHKQQQRYYSAFESSPQSHQTKSSPTKLTAYLTKMSVSDVLNWLRFFSFCSLEKQVQQCLKQLRKRRTEVIVHPLNMTYLSGLQRTHADQLLASLAASK